MVLRFSVALHGVRRKAVTSSRSAVATRAFASTAQQTSYDVAIVGGGVVGCNIARSLARRGVSVVLMEQNTLTSGTTWHAAGLVGTFKGDSMGAAFGKYGVECYRDMKDEITGENQVGWNNSGSLALARSQDSMEAFVRITQMCRGIGHDHHKIVTPAEIKEIHPFLELDGIIGGVHSSIDGFVNPADSTMWMAKEAREHGAKLFERTEVIGFGLSENGRIIKSVQTKCGKHITAGHVVFAGGAWMKKLSRMAFGENRVPVAMMPHQYVIFEKTEGVGNHLPVTRDFDNKYYLKPEVGGFMVGVFEGEPLEHLPEIVVQRNHNKIEMASNAEHELYTESFEKAGRWLEGAMETVPSLGEAGVKQWLNGPDTHSIDHSPFIGSLPGTENVHIATGFNSMGITYGPAVGVAIAETILDGALTSLHCDLSGAHPSRVYPGLCEDAEWVEKRAGEGYGKVYQPHYPLEGWESARGRRFSPLHAHLEKLGAVFGEGYGWERALYFPRPEEIIPPNQEYFWRETKVPSPALNAYSFDRSKTEYYEAEKRECIAARQTAALFDMSSFGKLSVTGPQALEVLQKCMTAEMDKPIGSITYTVFCDKRGGVLGDLTVTRLGPEEFYCVTLTPQPGRVADQLHSIAAMIGVATSSYSVKDVSEAKGVLALNGPNSRKIIGPLTDAALDNEAFPPGLAKTITVAGIELLALRMSFAGELGWELHAPAEQVLQVYIALESQGKPHGLIAAGTMSLLESLRTEKAFVHYGADVSMAETPLEAGLAFCCKLKPEQPDFVGKDAILVQKKEGWRKRLVSVQLAPDAGVSIWGHEQELLYRNGEQVGSLTSGCFSHTLGRAMGMGYIQGPPKVPKAWLDEGSYEAEIPLRLDDGSVTLQRLPVTISLKCLLDPKGARVRGE